MLYAYNRPTADFRSLHEAAIRMAGVLRNLPESQFTQIGLSRAWHTGKTRAATRRTAAAQPAINLNGSFLYSRLRAPDSQRPDDDFIAVGSLRINKLPVSNTLLATSAETTLPRVV